MRKLKKKGQKGKGGEGEGEKGPFSKEALIAAIRADDLKLVVSGLIVQPVQIVF
jgi:hypothetical protein